MTIVEMMEANILEIDTPLDFLQADARHRAALAFTVTLAVDAAPYFQFMHETGF